MAKVNKFLFWTPRILSILFILFIALFSLDVFESCSVFLECGLALFIHNLPSLILIVFLVIAWRWEWVGALGFLFFSIFYITFIIRNITNNGFEWYYISWFITIAGPSIVVGILWWFNWKKKYKKMQYLKNYIRSIFLY